MANAQDVKLICQSSKHVKNQRRRKRGNIGRHTKPGKNTMIEVIRKVRCLLFFMPAHANDLVPVAVFTCK